MIKFESVSPQFTVPHLVRTVEYYRDVFGFEVAGYWDSHAETVSDRPPAEPNFAIVSRGDVQFFFNQADGSEVRTGRAKLAYDAFVRVKGVEALAAELRGKGADIIEGPVQREYQHLELVVRDCNRLVITFAEATD